MREHYLAGAAEDFRKRLGPYYAYDEVEVAASRGTDPERAMRDEARRILDVVREGDVLWVLERTGTELSSTELAQRIDGLQRAGIFRLVLAIGGAAGAGADLLARANFRWSLSRLTFLHEWARVIVLEQLYRAAKIARNEPYHR